MFGPDLITVVGPDLITVVQRPNNFIRWIRNSSASKIYFTLNVFQGFRTLLN